LTNAPRPWEKANEAYTARRIMLDAIAERPKIVVENPIATPQNEREKMTTQSNDNEHMIAVKKIQAATQAERERLYFLGFREPLRPAVKVPVPRFNPNGSRITREFIQPRKG
jgi:hypothetical protein